MKFVLTHAEPCVAFADTSSLPLTKLEFTHSVWREGDETVVEHAVEMRGPLTFLFKRIIGVGIEKSLPSAVARLARLAESGS